MVNGWRKFLSRLAGYLSGFKNRMCLMSLNCVVIIASFRVLGTKLVIQCQSLRLSDSLTCLSFLKQKCLMNLRCFVIIAFICYTYLVVHILIFQKRSGPL